MTIHDRGEYETYRRKFPRVFRQFEGEVLAVADARAGTPRSLVP